MSEVSLVAIADEQGAHGVAAVLSRMSGAVLIETDATPDSDGWIELAKDLLSPLMLRPSVTVRSVAVNAIRSLSLERPQVLRRAFALVAASEDQPDRLSVLMGLMLDANTKVAEEDCYTLCSRCEEWAAWSDLDIFLERLTYMTARSNGGAAVLSMIDRLVERDAPVMLAAEAAARAIASLAPSLLPAVLERLGLEWEQAPQASLAGLSSVLEDVAERAGRHALLSSLSQLNPTKLPVLFSHAFSTLEGRATFCVRTFRADGAPPRLVVLGEPFMDVSAIILSSLGRRAEELWREGLRQTLGVVIVSVYAGQAAVSSASLAEALLLPPGSESLLKRQRRS